MCTVSVKYFIEIKFVILHSAACPVSLSETLDQRRTLGPSSPVCAREVRPHLPGTAAGSLQRF